MVEGDKHDNTSSSASIREQGNISLQCPKLTETNYTTWALLMETILKAHGLWKTVDAEDAVDEKKSHTSKEMIFQTLPKDVLIQVMVLMSLGGGIGGQRGVMMMNNASYRWWGLSVPIDLSTTLALTTIAIERFRNSRGLNGNSGCDDDGVVIRWWSGMVVIKWWHGGDECYDDDGVIRVMVLMSRWWWYRWQRRGDDDNNDGYDGGDRVARGGEW
ncbi:zinc finger, CCHC-type containing protein [Tanacetum coccineum]|uniref:Zinc finger, CCHC-type containing protein n=1 Tax=Tanacetum coccineum TaxID=301880 RepID=A0ABQ5J1P8_9ASTR